MTINTGSFEWQLFEENEENDESVWHDLKDQLSTRSSPKPNNLTSKSMWQQYSLMSILICVTLTSGLWLWYEAQLGQVLPIQALPIGELNQLIATENRSIHTQLSLHTDPPAGPGVEEAEMVAPGVTTGSHQPVGQRENEAILLEPQVNIRAIEQIDDRVLAEVLIGPSGTEDAAHTIREYRFYRHTESGWQLTAPIPTFWGAPEAADTSYFHLQFYARDSAVVVAAASRADRLYQSMRQTVGLTSAPERLTFEIVLRKDGPGKRWSTDRRNTITIPSPLLIAKPAAMADADLLYQLMANALVERVVEDASASYPISQPWGALRSGLMLWLFWQIDGPLSNTKAEILPWVYGTPADNGAISALENYMQACEFSLAIQRPNMPLLYHCVGSMLFSKQPQIALQLAKLPIALANYSEYQRSDVTLSQAHIWESASYASFFEYVDHRYGKEQIPALLAALKEHKGWPSLISAEFNMSVAEFDAEWLAFRQQKYVRPQ